MPSIPISIFLGKSRTAARMASTAGRPGTGRTQGSDDGAPGLTGMGRRHGDRAGQQASAGTAAIEVSYLTKDFGGRTAIADVSFSVTCGEVFGFLWPQQCRENYDRAAARH